MKLGSVLKTFSNVNLKTTETEIFHDFEVPVAVLVVLQNLLICLYFFNMFLFYVLF